MKNALILVALIIFILIVYLAYKMFGQCVGLPCPRGVICPGGCAIVTPKYIIDKLKYLIALDFIFWFAAFTLFIKNKKK